VRCPARHLGYRQGHKFLNHPCGNGRFSLPLAKMGVALEGVDVMPNCLEELADRGRRQGFSMELLHRDMGRIRYPLNAPHSVKSVVIQR
jgi:2-polyprenyl-3-methyl-5-hydroxy-6-metoxy-1,4-benzoquinol methylase